MRRIAILGSTGSIGCSALSVAMAHPDLVDVVGLAAGANASRFAEQVEQHRPRVIAMAADDGLASVRSRLSASSAGSLERSLAGPAGLLAVATHPDVDLVLCATTGTTALDTVFAAIEAGKTIALANKELLVVAGGLVMEAARRRGVSIIPVDSEHNAIHQCLHGRSADEVKRLILTASGGPFRDWTLERLRDVTPADALDHPTWRMGRKITVDSATLMNKGLEVIEARWLFDVPPEQIDVVVHPQSIIHSLVEFKDSSVIAQLGLPDMRVPIFRHPNGPCEQTLEEFLHLPPQVRVAADGSIPLPGMKNADELVTLVEWGMPPAAVLRAATVVAADLIDKPELGRLAEGCLADIIAVPGDPLSDITVTRDVNFVMKGGKVFKNDCAN